MAVNYSTTVKNARLAVTRDAIDGGSGSPSNGKLQIGNAGFATVLSEHILPVPSGAIASGVLSFTPPELSATGLASGQAAAARLVDSANVVVASGMTVGTTGADVLLNSVSIVAGQPVTITSATLTHG